MEEYKTLEEITRIDKRHVLISRGAGAAISLERLHSAIEQIEVYQAVPDEIRGQFNVARNMALYTYFCYSLAPEVHMKTYSVMEMALRRYYGADRKTPLKQLLDRLIKDGAIMDEGFRHVPTDPDNKYCLVFVEAFRKLRNTSAHGTSMLVPDCLGHLEICADFVNQLYPNPGKEEIKGSEKNDNH